MKSREESVDLLRPDRKNARRIPKERLAGLSNSMEEFGDLSCIVFNEQLGDLVAGHQRMRGLRAAGAKTWTRLSDDEGVVAHPKTGERFKVRIVRWEEADHRAAQIVANSPELQGEYTADVVAQLRELEGDLHFKALRLDELQAELDDATDDVDEEDHSGLDDFDSAPRPRPTWILVAAPEDVAAEIEGLLRGKYEQVPEVRIEKSSNVD